MQFGVVISVKVFPVYPESVLVQITPVPGGRDDPKRVNPFNRMWHFRYRDCFLSFNLHSQQTTQVHIHSYTPSTDHLAIPTLILPALPDYSVFSKTTTRTNQN